jgi:hypothetical protein
MVPHVLTVLSLPISPKTLTALLSRQGLKSLAHSLSRFKPTKLMIVLVRFNGL